MAVTYKINGKPVTRRKFQDHPACSEAGCPNQEKGFRETQEIASLGAKVHPKHAKAYEQLLKKAGCPTRFDSKGRPHFRSFRHQANYLRLMGYCRLS